MPQNGRRSRAAGRWAVRGPWLWAWLGALPLAVGRAGQLADSDTFWQIRTGQLILRTHRVPAVDPFSWTAYGRPWRPNSWAFDVLLATAYHPGRALVGVALVGIGLTMLAVAAQLLLAARLGAHPVAAGLMVLLATPVIVVWFSVRPQLVDYAAVPLLVVLLEIALTVPGRRVVALAGIAGLQVGWTNLHATAPLGIALAAVAGAADLATWAGPAPTRHRLGWAAAPALAAGLGTLVNPAGAGVLSQALTVRASSTGLISEWLPIDIGDPFMDLTILLGALTIAVAARRRWQRPAAVLLVLLVAGVAVRRFQPILAVCAIPVLAAALDTPRAREWAVSRRTMLRVGAATLTATYVTLAAISASHLGRVYYPYPPIRALPAGCRLFNSYDLGGIVILLRPDVPVSLDSRNDLYGRREVLDLSRTLKAGTGAGARLAALSVDCVLVRPSSPLGRQLSRDPAWREAAHHRDATAYVRRAG
jgi:hypothetical protein